MRTWDAGIRVFSRRTVPPSTTVLSLEFVRDKVLRVANGSVEDEYIRLCLNAATADAEDKTQRSLLPQTRQLVMSGFPCAEIELPGPPFISVESFDYVDADGATQQLAGSPAEYHVVSSGDWLPARITPLSGQSWPTTRDQLDAVTITYECGYENDEDPRYREIAMGIGLMVGEMYKIRALSVQEIQNIPSILQLQAFWKRVW
jgi:hypothetical protein